MLDGVLVIDKPAGLTSHDVVARVRRILRIKRVGHTGTLDPFATGVLVVLVGQATRLAQFLSTDEKEYEAVIRFGYATETGDATGERLTATKETAAETLTSQDEAWEGGPVRDESEIEDALLSFQGEIAQVPPMYSAKKVEGRKLYELARRGIEVERKSVRVTIYEIEARRPGGALLRRNEDGTCDLSVRVTCSAGTYIRTLAEDVGERLGAPAHLSALRRTRAGRFSIEQAATLEELEQRAGSIDQFIISSDAALSDWPFVHLTADEALRTLNGVALRLNAGASITWPEGQLVRMRDAVGRLIAVGFYDAAAHSLRPRVVLSPEK